VGFHTYFRHSKSAAVKGSTGEDNRLRVRKNQRGIRRIEKKKRERENRDKEVDSTLRVGKKRKVPWDLKSHPSEGGKETAASGTEGKRAASWGRRTH